MTTEALTLDRVLDALGENELEVVRLIAVRLLEGQQRYGRLDLAGDTREWSSELRAELLDALVYRAIGDLAASRWHTFEALARTQARCTELLEEVRTLRTRERGSADAAVGVEAGSC